jgi:hypothetical protein
MNVQTHPFTFLQSCYIPQHRYKRGVNKGDAPLYKDRRWKSTCLVQEYKTYVAVRMYSTNILTVTPDGLCKINLGGWEHSPTTRQAINHALHLVFRNKGTPTPSVHTLHKYGLSHTVVTIGRKAYRYYSGMTFALVETPSANHPLGKTHDVILTTPPTPFTAKRIDKQASRELMDTLKASGFLDVLPVLHETVTSDDRYTAESRALGWVHGKHLAEIASDPEKANLWPAIIARAKYTRYRDEANYTTTRTRLMREFKTHLYDIEEIDALAVDL